MAVVVATAAALVVTAGETARVAAMVATVAVE